MFVKLYMKIKYFFCISKFLPYICIGHEKKMAANKKSRVRYPALIFLKICPQAYEPVNAFVSRFSNVWIDS